MLLLAYGDKGWHPLPQRSDRVSKSLGRVENGKNDHILWTGWGGLFIYCLNGQSIKSLPHLAWLCDEAHACALPCWFQLYQGPVSGRHESPACSLQHFCFLLLLSLLFYVICSLRLAPVPQLFSTFFSFISDPSLSRSENVMEKRNRLHLFSSLCKLVSNALMLSSNQGRFFNGNMQLVTH